MGTGEGEERGNKAQDLPEEPRGEHPPVGVRGQGRRLDSARLGHLPRQSIQSFRSRRRIPTEARRGGRVDPKPLPGIDTDGAGPRYEGVIERGEGGHVGLWMDPAVSEEAVYREHWTPRGKVRVSISQGRIVIAAVDDH